MGARMGIEVSALAKRRLDLQGSKRTKTVEEIEEVQNAQLDWALLRHSKQIQSICKRLFHLKHCWEQKRGHWQKACLMCRQESG